MVVVLLSVPLYRRIGEIVAARSAIAMTLIVGSVIALATALASPVAISIAEQLGGVAGVTAAIVISTGIFGAVFGPMILDALHVEDDRAKGLALGIASQAIGAARAIQISEVAGAFASIGMILNALLTIALAPIAIRLVAGMG